MSTHPQSSFVFPVFVRGMFLLLNLFALHLLLRGHDAPGGGFIAGVCSAISLVLLSLGMSVPEARRIIVWPPARLAASGGILILVTCAFPMLFGRSFLTHGELRLDHVPFFESLTLSSSLIFEAGIYLIVVGVLTKIVFTFALSTEGAVAFSADEEELYSAPHEEPVEAQAARRKPQRNRRRRGPG